MSRRSTTTGFKFSLAALVGGGGGNNSAPVSPVDSPVSSPSSSSLSTRSSPALAQAHLNSSTDSSGGGSGGAPACAVCREPGGRSVHKVGYWVKKGTWVYLCSGEPAGSGGTGTGFCGHTFTEEQPLPLCSVCPTRPRLKVERRAGQFGHYCSACGTFVS